MSRVLPKLSTRQLVTLSMLIALNVVVSRYLSFMLTDNIKIGATFIVIAITGVIYGPVWGGVAGVIADLIGITIAPQGSGFFFGFTISAFVDSFIYGYFFSKKPFKSYYVFITVILSTVLVSYLMNTYWLTLITGNSFKSLFLLRFITPTVMAPIKIVVLIPLMKKYGQQLSRLMD